MSRLTTFHSVPLERTAFSIDEEAETRFEVNRTAFVWFEFLCLQWYTIPRRDKSTMAVLFCSSGAVFSLSSPVQCRCSMTAFWHEADSPSRCSSYTARQHGLV